MHSVVFHLLISHLIIISIQTYQIMIIVINEKHPFSELKEYISKNKGTILKFKEDISGFETTGVLLQFREAYNGSASGDFICFQATGDNYTYEDYHELEITEIIKL